MPSEPRTREINVVIAKGKKRTKAQKMVSNKQEPHEQQKTHSVASYPTLMRMNRPVRGNWKRDEFATPPKSVFSFYCLSTLLFDNPVILRGHALYIKTSEPARPPHGEAY